MTVFFVIVFVGLVAIVIGGLWLQVSEVSKDNAFLHRENHRLQSEKDTIAHDRDWHSRQRRDLQRENNRLRVQLKNRQPVPTDVVRAWQEMHRTSYTYEGTPGFTGVRTKQYEVLGRCINDGEDVTK